MNRKEDRPSIILPWVCNNVCFCISKKRFCVGYDLSKNEDDDVIGEKYGLKWSCTTKDQAQKFQ